MLVEVLARVGRKKAKTEEDLAEEEVQRIINPDFQPSDEEFVYTYEPMLIDILGVCDVFQHSSGDLQLMRPNGVGYMIQASLDLFKEKYQRVTGKSIPKLY